MKSGQAKRGSESNLAAEVGAPKLPNSKRCIYKAK